MSLIVELVLAALAGVVLGAVAAFALWQLGTWATPMNPADIAVQ